MNQEQQVREERRERRVDEEEEVLLVPQGQTDLPEIKDLLAQKDHLALMVFPEYLAYMGK